MTHRFLAFDIATQTGVAFAEGKDKPTFSTFTLGPSRASHAIRCAEAMRMTSRLIKRHRPTVLAIEAPYLDMAHPDAARLLYGLRGAVLGVAGINGLDPVEYTPSEIRSFFVGRQKMKRKEAKAAVWQMCKTIGWDVKTQDEADAGAVLEMARARAKISSLMPKGGLF